MMMMMMMMMPEDGHGEKMIMTKYARNIFFVFVPVVSVLLVSWWSLHCVLVVVGVLVALWLFVRSVSTFFSARDVLSVLSMSWWCSGWCLRGIEGMVFV